MLEANPLPTPMVSSHRLSAHIRNPIEDGTLYRSFVKALQYVTIARLETAFIVNKTNLSKILSLLIGMQWNAYWDT